MPRIVISYAKKDTRQLAENLYHALNAIPGLTAWMDMSLEADSSWAHQIMEEIDRCDYMVVLLSPDVNRSAKPPGRRSFVLNEIDYAQQFDKPILPVMAINTSQPVQIAGIQYIDLTKTPTDPTPVLERVQRRFSLIAEPESTVSESSLTIQSPSAPSNRRIVDGLVLVILLGALVLWVASRLIQTGSVQPTLIPREVVMLSQTLTTPTPTVDIARATAQQANAQATLNTQPTRSTNAIIIASENVNLREGPRTDSRIIGSVSPGNAYVAIGITESRDWLNIQLSDGTTGWIAAIFALTSLNPITANDQWTPVLRDFDGITMVLVPAGCFDMGSDDGHADEQPVNRQCFYESYWIDRTEVTQADFARLNGQKANPSAFDGDQRPVERITWFEARDFCTLRGMRLPTEAEWEYAARGPDNLIYPWGNEWNPENTVWSGNSNSQTAVVGSRPDGISWVGAMDMSGNVWEWVNSLYQGYPYVADDGREDSDNRTYDRISRGGSWLYATLDLRAPLRLRLIPRFENTDIGFRCARDYDAP